jgi:hypothetical protein
MLEESIHLEDQCSDTVPPVAIMTAHKDLLPFPHLKQTPPNHMLQKHAACNELFSKWIKL